jgi:riboflavin transporter FmnP
VFLGPVLAAATWFGRRAALAVALIASVLLTADVFLSPDLPPRALIGSVAAFIVVGERAGALWRSGAEQVPCSSRQTGLENGWPS